MIYISGIIGKFKVYWVVVYFVVYKYVDEKNVFEYFCYNSMIDW